MEDDSCPFSRLPIDLWESVLQRAFKQLSQQELHGTIPFVCHPFQLQAHKNTSSLEVNLSSKGRMGQLQQWVQRYAQNLTNLKTLSIKLPPRASSPAERLLPCPYKPLLSSIGQLPQLQSLSISGIATSSRFLPATPFPAQLSHLCLDNLALMPSNFAGLLTLTALKSLELRSMEDICSISSLFTGISNMPQLSSLDLSYTNSTGLAANDFTYLRSMSQLQQLRLSGLHFKAVSSLHFLAGLPVTAITISISEPGSASAAIRWFSQAGSKLVFLTLHGPSPEPAGHVMQLLQSVSTECPALTRLVLGNLDLYSMDPPSLCLSTLTQLSRLDLECCIMDAAGLSTLSTLSGLQDLSLYLVPGGSNSAVQDPGCMQCLAASLVQLTSLETYSDCREAVYAAFGGRVLGEKQTGYDHLMGFALHKAGAEMIR